MSKEIWTNDQISQLIQKITGGDKEAAKQLVANYADDIHFQAALYNSGKEEISQCFQKACNKAIRNISEIDLENPEKWFGSVGAEIAVSEPVSLETAESEYDSSDEHIDKTIQLPDSKAEVRKAVLHAMADLTAAERTAFALRFYEHLDNSEVAQKLRVDTLQVEALLANAKSALVQKDLSIPAVITAMNYLNPAEEEKEAVAAAVIPPAAETVAEPVKKQLGTKALLLALAGVVIAAVLFITISGKLNNSQTNTADGNHKTQDTQKDSDKTGSNNSGESGKTESDSANGSGSSEISSNDNNNNNTNDSNVHHGLVIEDVIVENISSSGNDGSNNNNPGTSGGNDGSSASTQPEETPSTVTPTPETGPGGSETPPAEDESGYDVPDEEIDLGGGDILGGF